MPVKHAPETRLPWGTWVGGKKCIYSCAIGWPMEKVANGVARADLLYIIHSANAYPKIVASLRAGADPADILRELGEV